jgi:hypothetical protein
MRAHVINNGVVVNTIEVESLDFMPGLVAATEGAIGDLWDGQVFTKPGPDQEQVRIDTTNAIQNLLDSTALAHGYDDLRSTISYVGSSVPKWNAEGVRAKAWRDECWTKAYEIQEAVKAGTIPLPSVEEVLAQMPPANWPTGV